MTTTTPLGTALRAVWALARRHPLPFAVSILGSLVFAAMSVGSTVVIGWVVDDIVVPSFVVPSSVVPSSVVPSSGSADAGPTATSIPPTWLAAIAVISISTIRALGVVSRRYYSGMTNALVQRSLRNDLGDKYTALPLTWFQQEPVGKLLAHIDSDAEVAADALSPLPFAIGATSMMIFGAISVLVVDPVLALIGLLLFPLMIAINRVYSHRVEQPSADVQQALGDVGAIAHESIDGSLIVKTIGRADSEVERFSTAVTVLRDRRVKVASIRAAFNALLDSLPQLGMVIVLIVGIGRVDAGVITTGDLVRVVALFTVLAFPVRVMGFFLESVPRSIVSQQRIAGVVDTPLPALPTARLAAASSGLRLDVREFGFDYGDTRVLRDVTVSVAEGEVLAIVGSTGSGKSTLATAMVGLTAPTAGEVTLNGVDVQDLAAADRTTAIGYAAQEPYLFADSIRSNIDLAGTATIDDIRWAAQIAQIDDFVVGLPDQYETVLGERGVTVSGGQRQRIALARALLGRPGLLLFDDATSAVDSRIEEQILNALETELNATTILVAQRPSTIALADRVLFLRNGTVRGIDTHEALMANPEYAQLVAAYEQAAS